MERLQPLVVAFAATALVAATVPARANTPKEKPPVDEGSAGLKTLVGGNLFSTPGNITPKGYEGLGFAGNGGGFGWGMGVYGEVRLFQHLGLELDVLHDSSVISRNVTYNSVVKVDERLTISSWRMSFLFKGTAPTPFGRLWLGLGPEVVLSSSVDGKNTVTSGEQYTDPAAIGALIHGESASSTLLDIAGGLVIHAGDVVEIPVDIRVLKNLSQQSDWDGRVKLDLAGNQITGYTVKGQSTWEFRMGLGIGGHF